MLQLPQPVDDGYCIPTVPEWSRDKHYFLMRYMDAFTVAMRKKKWSGLHYIDLFAGAGIEKLEDSGKLDWCPPMIAAQLPNSFTQLHLCELDIKKFEALKFRVQKFKPDAQILHGDANEKIFDIVKTIPPRTLSLAFLDPYGLHLEYETLTVLSQKRADLIIFFPDYLDALRNWELNYLDNPDSNLDRCLGKDADWRSILNKTPHYQWAGKLRDLYVQQIRKLGYSEFEYERISMPKGQPLYCLIFCSRESKAAEIWQNISRKKPDGQRTFDFPV